MIAFDAYVADQNSGGPTLSYSHTCSGADRILFVGATCYGASSVTVSYNGVAMTEIGSGSQDHLFYLVAPASGTNTVLVTVDAGGIHSGSVSYTGAKQTGVPDSFNVASQGAGSSTFDISTTTVADNCWLVAIVEAGSYGSLNGTGTTQRAGVYSSWVYIYDSNAAKTPAGVSTLEVTNGHSPTFEGVIASFAPNTVTAYTLDTATGDFTLTGIDVTFATATGYSLIADYGGFTLLGVDVHLIKTLSQSFGYGQFFETGFSANFVQSQQGMSWKLQVPSCETGTFFYDEVLMDYDSLFNYDCLGSQGHIIFWKLQSAN